LSYAIKLYNKINDENYNENSIIGELSNNEIVISGTLNPNSSGIDKYQKNGYKGFKTAVNHPELEIVDDISLNKPVRSTDRHFTVKQYKSVSNRDTSAGQLKSDSVEYFDEEVRDGGFANKDDFGAHEYLAYKYTTVNRWGCGGLDDNGNDIQLTDSNTDISSEIFRANRRQGTGDISVHIDIWDISINQNYFKYVDNEPNIFKRFNNT
jgi:hypothetical protein